MKDNPVQFQNSNTTNYPSNTKHKSKLTHSIKQALTEIQCSMRYYFPRTQSFIESHMPSENLNTVQHDTLKTAKQYIDTQIDRTKTEISEHRKELLLQTSASFGTVMLTISVSIAASVLLLSLLNPTISVMAVAIIMAVATIILTGILLLNIKSDTITRLNNSKQKQINLKNFNKILFRLQYQQPQDIKVQFQTPQDMLQVINKLENSQNSNNFQPQSTCNQVAEIYINNLTHDTKTIKRMKQKDIQSLIEIANKYSKNNNIQTQVQQIRQTYSE